MTGTSDPVAVSTYRRLMPGVFLGSHAVSEGFLTKAQLRRRGYRRLARNVYADPGLTFDHRLVSRGVALLLPPAAAIGGLSAATFHGAPVAGPRDAVTVICPDDVRWSGPLQVRVHRSGVELHEVEVVDDVPVTDPLRTAWDVAALESLGTSVAALDAMVRAGRLDLPAFLAAVASGVGRWGVTKVRRAAQLVDPRAASPPESRIRVALAMAGVHLVPQCPVTIGDEVVCHADLGDPDLRIAVEYEGEYHFTGAKIDSDDERYAAFEAAGWIVVRLSVYDLRNLDAAVAKVLAAMERRR